MSPTQPHGAPYALLGWPLAFSLSPAMFAAAFRATGLDATYAPRPTAPDDLAAAVGAVRDGALAGANVTVPHKASVRALLDDESDLVTAIGAVNTIVRTPHGLRGENTDVAGFRALLGRVVGVSVGEDRRAVVLGAGGAARAAVHVLLGEGYAVTVLARRSAQSGVLAAQLYRAHPGARLSTGPLASDRIVAETRSAGLLINATPVGAGSGSRGSGPDGAKPERAAEKPGAPGLWPATIPLPSSLTVLDLVAWPRETALVRRARECGARAEGGLAMLVAQAAESFALWTGRPAPTDEMRAAALAADPEEVL